MEQQTSEKKAYTSPAITLETELETKAGSPLGVPEVPLDLFGE